MEMSRLGLLQMMVIFYFEESLINGVWQLLGVEVLWVAPEITLLK